MSPASYVTPKPISLQPLLSEEASSIDMSVDAMHVCSRQISGCLDAQSGAQSVSERYWFLSPIFYFQGYDYS